MTVRGVDDQDVDTGGEQRFGPPGDVSVDADRCADQQPPVAVQRRTVQRGAQRVLQRHHADEPVSLDDQGRSEMASGQQVEDLRRRGVGRYGQQVAGHHIVHLSESVHPGCFDLADRPQRPAVFDDDGQCVGAFGQQRQRLADGGVRTDRDRRVVDRMRALDLADHRTDHVGRDVLRNDRHPAPPSDRLSHPPPGDGGHVGHDQWKCRADGVGAAQIDIESGNDRRAPGHHEHVGISQVVGRHRLQESHDVIVAGRSQSRILSHERTTILRSSRGGPTVITADTPESCVRCRECGPSAELLIRGVQCERSRRA